MKTLDVFLNFPVMDINRNVLWRDPGKVGASQVARMNAFWGDESCAMSPIGRTRVYLNGPKNRRTKWLRKLSACDCRRSPVLRDFPDPLPMRNSTGAIVYYLFFASQKDTAENIVLDIFKRYEHRGEP